MSNDEPNEKNEANTLEVIQPIPRRNVFKMLHSILQYCGAHPIATGLFSLVGLISFVFSIYTFHIGRIESNDTTSVLRNLDKRIEQKNRAEIGTYQNGTFLFEEPIEGVYSNFWTAYLLRTEPSPELTIRGEGKTIEFSGLITFNCDNGKYLWSGGSNFDEAIVEKEVQALVPMPVVRAAIRIFCWDKN